MFLDQTHPPYTSRLLFYLSSSYPSTFINSISSTVDVPIFQILRTNHNINREALAVLYRDITLVSIDWNQSERTYLSLFRMLQDRPFHHFNLCSPTSMRHYKYIIVFCTKERSQERWCSPKCVGFSKWYRFLWSEESH